MNRWDFNFDFWQIHIEKLQSESFTARLRTVSPLAPIGNLGLFPIGYTGCEETWLTRFDCDRQKIHSVTFKVVLEGASPVQTVSMGSSPVKYVCVCGRGGLDKWPQQENAVTGEEAGHETNLNWLNNIRALHYLHYLVSWTHLSCENELKTQRLTTPLQLTCWPAITPVHGLYKVGAPQLYCTSQFHVNSEKEGEAETGCRKWELRRINRRCTKRGEKKHWNRSEPSEPRLSSHNFMLRLSQLFDMLLLGKSENTHILAQIKHADETLLFNVGIALCTSQNG